jgi:hypothetical protein
MEINEKVVRELKKKFEAEMSKREAEVIDHWKAELDVIYKKRYENLSSLQVDVKNLMERMSNRVAILGRMARENS